MEFETLIRRRQMISRVYVGIMKSLDVLIADMGGYRLKRKDFMHAICSSPELSEKFHNLWFAERFLQSRSVATLKALYDLGDQGDFQAVSQGFIFKKCEDPGCNCEAIKRGDPE